MKSTRIRKTIAVVSVIAGVLWLCVTLVSPIKLIFSEKHAWEKLIFIFTVVPLMAIPAVIAIRYGSKLYRSMTLESLKWVLGVFATFGALVIATRLPALFPDFPQRVGTGFFFLIGILVAVPAYLVIIQRLLPLLGAAKAKTSDLLGKGVLGLIAWLIWSVVSDVLYEYRSSWMLDGLELIWVFVPILVAYGAYRLAVALLLKPDA